MLLTVIQWFPTSKIWTNLPTGVPMRWHPVDWKTDIGWSPSTSGNCSFSMAEQWSMWRSVSSSPRWRTRLMASSSCGILLAVATGRVSARRRLGALVPTNKTSSTSWGTSYLPLFLTGEPTSRLQSLEGSPEDVRGADVTVGSVPTSAFASLEGTEGSGPTSLLIGAACSVTTSTLASVSSEVTGNADWQMSSRKEVSTSDSEETSFEGTSVGGILTSCCTRCSSLVLTGFSWS